MNWIDRNTGKPKISLKDFNDAIGFIYLIEFDNGQFYIGKKALFSIVRILEKKTGKPRENVRKRISTIRYGKKVVFEEVIKESKWRDYIGSHQMCKKLTVKAKYILDYAYTNIQLTYLEAKYLFAYEVLESSRFLNDNILGRFYRSKLNVTSKSD